MEEPPPRSPLLAAIEFLEVLRQHDPEMPAHHAQALLVIARHGPMPQQDVMRRLNLSKSAVSRIFAKLGDAEDGLSLLIVREDVMDRRRKLASLSPKVRAFVSRVFDLMGF